MSTDLHYISAHQALRQFRSGELSPVELLQALIDRAEQVEPKVNAFADTYFDEAMDKARLAEKKYSSGQRTRPLEGIPVVIKDEIRLKGKRTTAGSLTNRDRIDTYSDVIAERLLRAGAIVHARSTTPEFCICGTTYSRIWGVTRNPHNMDYTPGGSSGGTGAALAAGTTTLGTGTDIAGSIRIPAACCGVVGLKATHGRIPEAAVFNLDSYSHSGPMTRDVTDCALMFNVIAGPSPRDINSIRPRLQIPPQLKSIKDWKIAWSMDLGYYEVDKAVVENTHQVLDALRSLGATVEEVKIPWTDAVERAAIDYLNHTWAATMQQVYDEQKELLTDYACKFVENARTSTPLDFLAAQEVAYRMYADTMGPLLNRFNLFVCPTNAVPAVVAEHDSYDPDFRINGVRRNAEYGWIMTHHFNMLSKCPVMSVPSGKAANGVPTGIQLVGRTFDEVSVFRAAKALEQLVAFSAPDL